MIKTKENQICQNNQKNWIRIKVSKIKINKKTQKMIDKRMLSKKQRQKKQQSPEQKVALKTKEKINHLMMLKSIRRRKKL